MPTLQQHSEQIALSATVLAATINAAVRALEESLAGYPTQTPLAGPADTTTPEYTGLCQEHAAISGPADNPTTWPCLNQRPCEWHDTAQTLTRPEAQSQHTDKARADMELLKEAVNKTAHWSRIASDLSSKYGTPAYNESQVASKLAAFDSLIWCENCARHGHKAPRTNGKVCEFCSQVKSDHKQYPNAQLLDIHHSGRKVSLTDIHRCFRKPKPTVSTKLKANPSAAKERRARRIQGAA